MYSQGKKAQRKYRANKKDLPESTIKLTNNYNIVHLRRFVKENKQGGKNSMEKQKFIVRCDRAGAFYGEIEERNGREVKMRNVRCLWYWDGAATLLQLAAEGTTKPESCKFTMTIDSLEVLDAIEIIPCTAEAIKSIEGVKEWKR